MATIIHQRYIEQHTCVSPESAKVCRECRVERERRPLHCMSAKDLTSAVLA